MWAMPVRYLGDNRIVVFAIQIDIISGATIDTLIGIGRQWRGTTVTFGHNLEFFEDCFFLGGVLFG
jgi:hypothetical protein